MKGLITEFKTFALRGSVIDLAVGVIIGAAFGKITSSLVANVITPILGLLTGGVDVSNRTWVLKHARFDREGHMLKEAVVMHYGVFIQSVIDFIIIAFVIFICIKAINTLKRKEDAEPTVTKPSREVELLEEIRDALRT